MFKSDIANVVTSAANPDVLSLNGTSPHKMPEFGDNVTAWRQLSPDFVTFWDRFEHASIAVPVLSISISTVAIAFNLPVVLAICSIRRSTSILVLVGSLATADLLASSLWLITVCFVQVRTSVGVLDDAKIVLRHLSRMTSFWLLSVSATSVCVVAIDRYMAVLKPIRHRWYMTPTKMRGIVATQWTISLCVSGVFLLLSFARPPRYNVVVYCWMFIDLACVSVVAATCAIYAKLYCCYRAHQRDSAMLAQRSGHQNEARLSWRLLVCAVVFAVCFAPFICVHLISLCQWRYGSDTYFYVEDAVWTSSVGLTEVYLMLVARSTAVFNALLYAWSLPQLRRALHQICCFNSCCLKQRKHVNRQQRTEKGLSLV
ncbi:PREDICTED: adenosine receptor A2b-like [Priapulus caudatus]|uniref:Adenosine receptor A2b-like n=1 Tax=Priapulus caudatus TaxID=37621 RepID=A0ABM1F038_PRICU|nr:PREDICTED: adenosine receptor A2b-like [Priapulus caudatus]XP_014677809.1 PREDICTED: adenosine receptor A2b-like [Priapulus caudatus]